MNATQSSNYQILDTKLGKGTFAAVAFNKGDLICPLEGVSMAEPSKYTVQVGVNEHIIPVFGKYLNHSCSPNCYLQQSTRTFRALGAIDKGDELTFDYNTTEYYMAAPFACECGSNHCYKTVRGFKYLNATQKEKIKDLVPRYFFEGK